MSAAGFGRTASEVPRRMRAWWRAVALVGAIGAVAACSSTNAAEVASAHVPSASPVVTEPDPTAAADSVLHTTHQTQWGSLKSGGIIRVVWAHGDLSGRRELLWVAGGVQPYRDASCTQRFQLGNEPKPARKPSLLLCWRTSARRSVIVVLVAAKGTPSRARAVRELDHKWRALD